MYASTEPDQALWWARFGYHGVFFIPIFFWHAAVTLLQFKRSRLLVILTYATAILFSLINRTELFLSGTLTYFWGYYPSVGAAYHFFVAYFFSVFTRSLYLLYKGWAREGLPPTLRNRAKYAFLAFLIAGIFGIFDFLPNYGIGMYPCAYIGAVTCLAVVIYAIVRFRLLDITIALTRTALFALAYVPLLLAPFVLAWIGKGFLDYLFGPWWWIAPMVLEGILAAGGLLLFLSLKERAEATLLAEERKAHEALRKISQNMMHFTRMKALLGSSVKNLVRILQVPHAATYLFSEEKGLYERKAVWHSPPRKDSTLPASIPENAALLKDLAEGHLPRVREELKLQQQGISPQWKEMVEDLERLQASVVIPAFKQNRLFGFVLLGEKRSGRIWTQDDLNVLTVLANQSALAIENAQLHEAEEARLIKEAIEQTAADISYGVSHQFNNRLYVISILASTQVLSLADKDLEKLSPDETKTWLKKLVGEMRKITEEAEMGGQISKGIMSLAKAIPENFKPVEVPPLIEHAVEFVRLKHAKEKVEGESVEPEIVNGVPKDLSPVSGNAAQIHDSFMNIVDNAMDAIREKIYRTRRGEMPSFPEHYKGQIKLQAEEKDGWIVVTIEDDGIGIEKENMRRVFAPYFTTKATGVKGRGLGGHGLGLYFIKRIVEAHGGRVYVHSEHTKWTRFTVELPVSKERSIRDAA